MRRWAEVTARMVPDQVGDWVLHDLPRLNTAILDGRAPPGLLVTEADQRVLRHLPDPGRLAPGPARRLVVQLGLLGASVARHYQERTPDGRRHPERAFEPLLTGEQRIPFRRYFAALAGRTGTGHYGRDSYASLVRWNVGTVRVRLRGEVVAELPGVFDDGRIRSYTGTPGEESFFLLVKQGEAIESAVNRELLPLTGAGAGPLGEEAGHRVRQATALLDGLRRLLVEFATRPAGQTMTAEAFMDVFRQFAAHWAPDDIPPSGALDPEALKRDFLLGIALPGYDQQARRLFPALLDQERAEIGALMEAPPLPDRLLADLGSGDSGLALPAEQLRRLVARRPVLADWYRLLAMHAQVSGAHLMLSRKFLFKPQERREAAGLGDPGVVSNRTGTTGMTQTHLERLTRARQRHALAALRPVLIGRNPETAGHPGVRCPREAAAPVTVELVG
ncbi:hypothetical protein [Actinoplanes siamensis]|uniref:Uncharacterized protein n=1 Tax=Actinoplanes siamensis TaxID=1223317 RepID=A0A919KBX0_9ACTN|nr:hypothetical protein [Actinoplanes siamensis]GIF02688.1 hypothetical protein Asi03nite_02260 [Actinoplanes siamensis]